MRLLVTGGSGQLGEALRRLGPAQGAEIVAPSRDEMDLADPGSISRALTTYNVDLAVNGGAYTQVDKAESEPDLAQRVNGDAPGRIAAICADKGWPLIHVSTDYVFDGRKSDAYLESDPVAPLGVYGRTKEAGERAVRTASPRHVVMRTSWVYASHGANFVKTMLRLARERDELRVVADQRGIPTSADDLAAAILTVAKQVLASANDRWGTYHYSADGPTTWHEFACAIVERAAGRIGRKPKVTAIATADYPTPARRPANSVLDCRKIMATFAPPRRPWQAGLDEVLARLLA
jgi:dTDP-4-dehydrorhamnose reductase